MSAVTPSVTSEGQTLDAAVELLSITVHHEINRVPTAEIRVVDGSAPQQRFEISDDSFFAPGAPIDIAVRYEGQDDQPLFSGIVVGHEVEADAGGSRLAVRLKDPSVSMTRVRHRRYHEGTDAEVMTAVITDAGHTAGDIGPATAEQAPMVQFDTTDWDFLLARADANGLVVTAEGGTVSARPVAIAPAAAHTYAFGVDPIYDFSLELDGSTQIEAVEATAWDLAAQALTEPATAEPLELQQGSASGADLAREMGIGPARLTHAVRLSSEELSAWATGREARSRLALLRGRLRIPGDGAIRLLDTLELAGIGERFNGRTAVTGVVQRLDGDGWTTDVQFGVDPSPVVERLALAGPDAGGLLTPARGLQIGKVIDLSDDPDEELRILVALAGIDPADGRLWARLSSPDAGPERGFLARPEPGDEVVLGFLGGDPRRPVILGSLHGSAQAPPPDLGPIDEDNHRKGFVSRSGLTVLFDDDKASITIQTPAANTIVLDDDAESVTVKDQHENRVVLSSDGISISTDNDLTLQVGGDVKVSADGNVEIAGSQVDVK